MIRNMEILSHTPAAEVKKGPVWVPYVCAFGIAALMYGSHLFGNGIPGYLCMTAAIVALMMIGLFTASRDIPESYHVRFAPGMTVAEMTELKKKWHVCEHADGTAKLIRKFPEEEEDNV